MSTEESAGMYQWFGFTGLAGLQQGLREDSLIRDDCGILSVVLSSERTIGRVEWFEASWGRRDTSACWTIAASIFAPYRAQGYGTQAQRQLVEYLFQHTRAHRIQAYTDIENKPEQRALEAAGLQLEGVLRGAQWRQGQWRDQALFSILRTP